MRATTRLFAATLAVICLSGSQLVQASGWRPLRILFGGDGYFHDPSISINPDVMGEGKAYPLMTSEGTLVVPRGVPLKIVADVNTGRSKGVPIFQAGIVTGEPNKVWPGYNVLFSAKVFALRQTIQTSDFEVGTHKLCVRAFGSDDVRYGQGTVTFSIGPPLPAGLTFDEFMAGGKKEESVAQAPIVPQTPQPTVESKPVAGQGLQPVEISADGVITPVVPPAPPVPTCSGDLAITGPKGTPIHLEVKNPDGTVAFVTAANSIIECAEVKVKELKPGQTVGIWLFDKATCKGNGGNVEPNYELPIPSNFSGARIRIGGGK